MFAALLACTQLQAVDFGWQWRVGQSIAQSGLSETERFTLSARGAERIESSWLYCVALYQLERHAGIAGVIVVKALLIAMAWVLALLAAPVRSAAWLSVGVALLAALAASPRFMVRPEVVSFVCFAAHLAIIQRARSTGGHGLLVALPGVQLLWVNTHTFFAFGVVLPAAWLAERVLIAWWRWSRREPIDARSIAWPAGLTAVQALVCVASPWGVAGALVPLQQFGALQQRPGVVIPVLLTVAAIAAVALVGVGLWLRRRVDSDAPRRGSGRAAIGFVCLALTLLALGVLAFRSSGAFGEAAESRMIIELAPPWAFGWRLDAVVALAVLALIALAALPGLIRRGETFWVLLLLATAALTAQSVRAAPLFALVAMPAIIAAPWPRRLRGPGRAVAVLLVAAAIVYAWSFVTDRASVRQGLLTRAGFSVNRAVAPIDAADALAQRVREPRVFASQPLSSHLVRAGITPFLDSRGVAGSLFAYREAISDDDALRTLIDRYRINACLIEADHLELIARVRRVTGWPIVYADGVAVLLRDHSAEPSPAELGEGRIAEAGFPEVRIPETRARAQTPVWSRVSSPMPALRAARVAFLLGRWDAAATGFARADAAWPARFADERAWAVAALESGDPASAAALFARSAERRDNLAERARDHAEAAEASLAAGEPERAGAWAERALAEPSAQPRDRARAAFVAGVLALRARDDERALDLLAAACSLAPNVARHQGNHATALALSGDLTGALAALERAHALDPNDPVTARDAATMALELGRPAEARRWAVIGLRLDPADSALRRVLERTTRTGGR
ncbi:MAG: tetratricopeptide repeat protein [Planctomycetota bacterium]